MTEQGQRMLKPTVLRRHQLSAESIAKYLQTSCGLHKSFMEWVSMAEQLHLSIFHHTKCNAKHWMQWCKAL
ncbi:unnamed protein product, partial [Staurois parvus]